MAYREVYRSQIQSSNTSISPIDGIGIKIHDRLVPPPRVTIPAEYEPGNPSEILFMEYDFSVEEHILEWIEVQRKNEQAVWQAATDRVGDTIQTFSQVVNPSPASVGSGPKGSDTAWGGPEQVAPPVSNPSPFINLGSSILTPMPISWGHVRKESGSNKTQTGNIDLKDFENEQDPFENMALKVLNDREELNKMVFEVQPMPRNAGGAGVGAKCDSVDPAGATVSGGSQLVSQPSPPCTPVNLQDVDYPEVESLKDGQFSVLQKTYTGRQVAQHTDSHQDYYQTPQTAPCLPTSQPIAASAAYSSQNISRENTFAYSQGAPLPTIPTSQCLVQQLATSSGGPMCLGAGSMPVSSTVGSVIGETGSVNMTAASVTYTKQSDDGGYVPYQNYYSRHSKRSTSNGHVLPGQVNNQPLVMPRTQDQETPPLNPLRSARSTPDISGSEDRKLPPPMPSSQTPPPTATCARSRSPSDLTSSGSPQPPLSTHQNWNHYSTIPSMPNTLDHTPIYLPKSVVTNVKSKLPNPFDSLPPEAQRYVENITDMGFPRARVARAVQKLGTDDKNVVDHLCMVNPLLEKGYAEDDAETALHLFENNIEKAEQYLKLFFQFKEIGFIDKNIHEALVSTNLDKNKTLDILTAS